MKLIASTSQAAVAARLGFMLFFFSGSGGRSNRGFSMEVTK